MAVTTVFGMAGCGKETKWTSVDLDGDGKISAWETIFDGEDESTRTIGNSTSEQSAVKNISNLKELLAINNVDSEDAENVGVIYKLTDDINCNGEAVCINLHGAILLGNNKNIYNFKLTKITYADGDESSDAKSNDVKYALFHNGVAIYDLHIFMGKQVIDYSTLILDNNYCNYISPIFNVYGIENVKVRGNLSIPRVKMENANNINNTLNVSMLVQYSSTDTFYINDCEIIGEINYSEAKDSGTSTSYTTELNVGGVVKTINRNLNELPITPNSSSSSSTDSDDNVAISSFNEKIKSMVCNTNVNLNINIANANKTKVGLVACENEGFVTNCNTAGTIKQIFADNTNGILLSGVVANNYNLGEIRYCETTAEINIDNPGANIPNNSSECVVAGIVGNNDSGILDYVTSDAKINIKHLIGERKWVVYTGSIMGKSVNGYLTRALAKGSIECQDVVLLNVANVIGYAENGMIDRVVATTTINVNELENKNATVNMGLIAIFEDLTSINNNGTHSDSTKDYYGQPYYIDNYANSPIFTRTIVSGINEAHLLNISPTNFRYRLGLRNPYLHFVEDREVSDNDGNITSEPVHETHTPYTFKNNFYSNEEYDFLPYSTDNDGVERRYQVESNIEMYANDGISGRAKSLYSQPMFAQRYLGLKNVFENPEINWDGDTNLQDLKFTLYGNQITRSIFNYNVDEDRHPNGELASFDYNIDGPCTFVNETDEMLSVLYYTIMNETRLIARPIVVSDNFLTSDFDYLYHDETGTLLEGKTAPEISASNNYGEANYCLAKNVEYLLKVMLNANEVKTNSPGINNDTDSSSNNSAGSLISIPMVSYLNSNLESVYDNDVIDKTVRYIRLIFTDDKNSNLTYMLTFDVKSMQKDLGQSKISEGAEYIIYMDFTKTSR